MIPFLCLWIFAAACIIWIALPLATDRDAEPFDPVECGRCGGVDSMETGICDDCFRELGRGD